MELPASATRVLIQDGKNSTMPAEASQDAFILCARYWRLRFLFLRHYLFETYILTSLAVQRKLLSSH